MACPPRSSPCAKTTCSCSTTSSRRAPTRPSRQSLASSLVWSSRATTRWCWFRNRARTRRRRRRRPPPRRRHVRPGGSGGITFLASAESTVRRALAAAAARRPELFAPGTRLVVGFSGGQDSSCLLHALSRPRMRLVVVAAHVDHALRLDSAEAAARVKDAAAAIGVACQVRRVDVPGYRAGLPAWGVQQAARAARYHALVGVTREHDAAALLVAHTADDQAETLLLDLLPALEGYNPAIRDVLARTADLVAEDLAALEAVVEGLYAGVVRGGGRGQARGQASSAAEVVELDLAVFRGQPRGLQRRLLRRALRSLLGSLVDVRASPIEDALDLIRSGTPSQTHHLPHGVELCIGSETFLLRMHGKARHRTRRNTWDSQVP